MDKFHEQLLTTKKTPIFTLFTGLMILFGLLAIISLSMVTSGFNMGTLILFLICTGAAVAGYFLRDRQYREYEYTFANGNLQIDVIYNMKKRKVVLDKDVKDFEEFGKTSESRLPQDVKRVKCYPNDKKGLGEEYYILVSGKQRTAYVIIPDEENLKYISLYYKRKIR